jgi:hypothetical protein
VIEHARLIREVNLRYPVILGPDGRVMDGMHRVARAILEAVQRFQRSSSAAIPRLTTRSATPRIYRTDMQGGRDLSTDFGPRH